MIRIFTSAAFIAAFFLAMANGAQAQDVTLTSRDGALEISGKLLTFDGEFYRVETVFGELTLDGQAVVCDGPGCPDLESYVAEFTLSGARSMGEVLMPALIGAFAERRGFGIRHEIRSDSDFRLVLMAPGDTRVIARIGFRLNTTAEGFADLMTGEADLAMAVREITDEEAGHAREAGLGDLTDPQRNHIVALDALVPIVSRSSDRQAITPEDLAGLLSGQVPLWPGDDNPVTIHAQDPQSGLSQLIEARLLDPEGQAWAAQVTRHADSAALADAVASDPFAVGVTRLSELGNARPLRVTGACGMSPALTAQSVKAEDYPFSAPLFLYVPARRLPLVGREFLDFLSSPTAQIVVQRAGFVDQSRETMPMNRQGERLANAITNAGQEVTLDDLQQMVRALDGAQRLTTSFRFRGGSAQLDAQSARNVADLAKALESGLFEGRTLILAGFSDGEGGAVANRRIAQRRAEAVREAIIKAAPAARMNRTKLHAEGFGEILPMACDDSDWGRGVNRRVEVWLR